MKIQRGKCFAIYVSNKVNDNVIDFLNRQKNVSETIISLIDEYISKKDADLESLAKRVAKLEELVHNTSPKTHSKEPKHGAKVHAKEVIDDEDNDIELLFKQLNE